MNKPLVSAIIIFLNEEKFLREAIESVFAQTYDEWELLLVDDGSTDASTEIASRYAGQRQGKVRYLEHEGHQNRGMSASRNLGIRHAKGEYIAFLDADDVWLPHKLERQIEIFESYPAAAMVYGATQYWHSWTGEPEDCQRDYVPRLGIGPDTLIMPPTLLTLSLKSAARTPCPSDFLVRRDVVEDVGGFEEHFCGVYQLYEDQAFLAKAFLKAPIFIAGECWDRYRKHPDSCVSVATRAGKKYSAGLFYLSWLERYLLSQAIKDADLWEALRDKRFRYRHPTLYKLPRRIRYWIGQMKGMTRELARRTLLASVRRSFRSQ